jgi:hypothetical protein
MLDRGDLIGVPGESAARPSGRQRVP